MSHRHGVDEHGAHLHVTGVHTGGSRRTLPFFDPIIPTIFWDDKYDASLHDAGVHIGGNRRKLPFLDPIIPAKCGGLLQTPDEESGPGLLDGHRRGIHPHMRRGQTLGARCSVPP
ncbi:hypothetical protein L6452_06501 [Arctium lappa]|uniref:Uncharacterized protein n=1 Tax=Arctium lappa TaxID=4217 RepID=A0ACB9EK18_ARCLA|nr:hypothetical protein L6452_06501 [Arctium lappa]